MNKGIINRLGNQEYPMGSVLVNENYKQKIIEDAILIEFNHLYANIILQFYDNNLLKTNTSVETLRWFFKNRKDLKLFPDEYKKWKTKVNGFWALNLNKEDQIRTTEYINIFNQDIFEEFEDDIVYIDTDCIFLKNYNDKLFNKIKDINLPFDKSEVKCLWVERGKILIYIVDGYGIVERGFRSSTYKDKAHIIKKLIISKSRNAKINEILKI